MQTPLRQVSSYLLLDVFGSLPRFPLWWYGRGWLDVIRWAGRSLRYRWQAYAIALWAKNFLVPMYGQLDWTSRLISFVARAVVIAGRLFAFAIEAAVYGLMIIGWASLPLLPLSLLLINLLPVV